MLKYLFMGSPPFAAQVLQKLCASLYPPTAVVTQTSKATGRGQTLTATAVEAAARTLQLPVIATDNVNAPETFDQLRADRPDLILVVAFGQILKEPILTLPSRYCLNVHASLLPEYRGAAPIQRAIWDGKTKTGITIQKMARKLDTGDILLQRELLIDPADTSATLFEKLAVLGGECLVEAVRTVEKKAEVFVPQDESRATHAAKLDRTHAPLDWTLPAASLRNQIRALQPWPVAETTLGGTKLKIFQADEKDAPGSHPPGTITTDSKTFIAVTAGDGRALFLTEIQLENRKKIGVKDFLLGYRGAFPYSKIGS